MSTTFNALRRADQVDFWSRERDSAEVVEPFGVRVLRQTSAAGRTSVKIWRPKAVKPEANYWFKTPEAREAFVTKWLTDFATAQAIKAERKAERKAVVGQSVGVGTIFVHSWGYDQTNVDYYEVVKASGSYVEVKPIASTEVDGSQGMMSAQVKPVPGAFINKTYRLQDAHGNYKTSLRKRVQYLPSGEPYLSFEYGWCHPVRGGESHYSSWYA